MSPMAVPANTEDADKFIRLIGSDGGEIIAMAALEKYSAVVKMLLDKNSIVR